MNDDNQINMTESNDNNTTSSSTISKSSSVNTNKNNNNNINRYGRKFHNETNSTYWLPNDDEEMDRLVSTHLYIYIQYKRNIPKVVIQNKMIPLENGAKILDVGCGPGTWIMDVATEFPTSECIGLDMCDVFPTNIRPKNVSFQIGNVLLNRLPFEDNTFDMVYLRLFILAFRSHEWIPVLKEILRVLKPGGCFLSLEACMFEDGNDFTKCFINNFIKTMLKREQEPFIANKMKDFMKLAGFDAVKSIKKNVYLGRPDQVNREFLWDLRTLVKSIQPFFAEQAQISDEKYPQYLDDLITNCQKQPECIWPMISTLGRKPL
ncbi:S-adenosyl-L-methionine-dependent methyltransferase [Cokeromyces recurvatus]|uniref:S-adenosyl-L-methionine-dependent methyltransferase n=1 Tax=Cokeromyces recurvatus TaxID=90255 RepID=UPI0022202D25|nr:S-adenosyl-L-methionine-dependent methyltransferase [Cokeromyces recurvatus]KAI7903829.1 S-adenosyl-L-methionine-dependent methyltransferase [Cokeromyces recurvatus]